MQNPSQDLQKKQSDPKGNRKAIGAVLLTLFLDLVGFSIVFPLFPSMLQYYLELEGESGMLGLVLRMADKIGHLAGVGEAFTPVLFGGILGSLYSILQFAMAPLWGAISDRIGRRRILLFTIAGTTLGYLIWIFSGTFLLLVVARIIGGVMSGNIAVSNAAVADLSDRKNRAKAMGLVGAAFGLGFVTGPALGALFALWNPVDTFPGLSVVGVNPYSGAALGAFVLCLFNWIWVWKAFPETLTDEMKRKAAPLSKYSPLRALMSNSDAGVHRASLLNYFFLLAFSGMEFTLSFLGVSRFGFNIQQITGMMVFVGFVLIVVQGGLIRRMAPKFGEKQLVVVGLLLVMLGLALLSQAATGFQLYGALTVMSTGAGMVTPCLSALVSLYSSEESQGKSLGCFRAWGALARAIGPLMAGFMFWWVGADKAYILGAAIVLIPLSIGLFLPKPLKD